MTWKKYLEYKDSGIEWLGAIPECWEVEPLKRTFQIINGSTPKSGEPSYWDGDIAWATPDDLGSLKGDTLHITQRSITQVGYESCGTSLAPSGSLVLSTRAPIGHLALSGVSMCTNQGCRCLTFLNKANHKFYYYQLLSAKHELESWGQGSTFKELRRDKLGYVCLVKPPLEEQNTIAAFLNNETERIDTLIAKKERQIELLQEKRSALISHAVTKGLNPDVKMKDSGIEWLGTIPEHWNSKKLKFLAQKIIDGTHLTPTYVDTGIPFLRVTDIHTGVINFDEVKRIPKEEHLDLTKRCCPHKGDLLLSKNGTIGVPCVVNWDGEFSIFVSLCLIKVKRELEVDYAKYFILSNEIREQIFAGGKKNTITNLHLDKIREFFFATPPILEQRTIAAFLGIETERLDNIIKKVQESITKLHEYRTALISAAVTGKIDVRKEVA